MKLTILYSLLVASLASASVVSQTPHSKKVRHTRPDGTVVEDSVKFDKHHLRVQHREELCQPGLQKSILVQSSLVSRGFGKDLEDAGKAKMAQLEAEANPPEVPIPYMVEEPFSD